MAKGAVTRRLTTIVAADVAGYSRLMGADEEGTLAALRAHRSELIDPQIYAGPLRLIRNTHRNQHHFRHQQVDFLLA